MADVWDPGYGPLVETRLRVATWNVWGRYGPCANPWAAKALDVDRRIDFVLVGHPRAAGAGHVVSAGLLGDDPVDGVVGSDHYGVVAELRY